MSYREFTTVNRPNVYIPTWSVSSIYYIEDTLNLCHVLLTQCMHPIGGVDERQGEL